MGFKQFIQEGLWKRDLQRHPENDPWYYRIIKALIIAVRGFDADGCSIRASALTYYTLFAIVPILALAFGIAKGFDLDTVIEREVQAYLPNYGAIGEKLIEFSKAMLNETKGGVIAGFGLLFLFWALINVLNNIEETFNHIWLVRKGRNWKRKITDYISVGILIPVLLIIANSFTLVLLAQIKELQTSIPTLALITDRLSFFFRIFPFLLTWIALWFLYMFMPNVKVKFRSAILASLIAAALYHLFQWIYVYFQVGISSYGAIYGSFAAFPLFLIWLQIGWMIILFGAELSYAFQNLGIHGLKNPHLTPSVAEKRVIALAITSLIGESFRNGDPPYSDREIAETLGLPYPLTSHILGELSDAHIVSLAEDGKRGYQPARALDDLSIVDLVGLYEGGKKTTILRHSPYTEKVEKLFLKLRNELQTSSSNVTLKNL